MARIVVAEFCEQCDSRNLDPQGQCNQCKHINRKCGHCRTKLNTLDTSCTYCRHQLELFGECSKCSSDDVLIVLDNNQWICQICASIPDDPVAAIAYVLNSLIKIVENIDGRTKG